MSLAAWIQGGRPRRNTPPAELVQSLLASAASGAMREVKQSQETIQVSSISILTGVNISFAQVRMILATGVPTFVKDASGRDALFIAAQEGHVDVVRALARDHGASVNTIEGGGSSAVLAASFNGERLPRPRRLSATPR